MNCFHCGLPADDGGRLTVIVLGESRTMCCAGCQAVAQAIVASGMEQYYRQRSVPGAPPPAGLTLPADVAARESPRADLAVFDEPAVQASFVLASPGPDCAGAREADLLVAGLQCPACVWLNEGVLNREPGVLAFELNFTTERARVRWNPERIALSAILARIAAIGYSARPYDARAAESARRAERKRALWRVFVAGFGMMQVMMYAVPAYLAGEGEMTPDIAQLMRLASFVLTVPVIGYSALPFFVNAWRDIVRVRRLGMDVPVAIGLAVAAAASVWNTFVTQGEVWYDSITMFVFLLLGARYLELIARQRAARSLEALAARAPASAERLDDWPASETARAVAASSLAPGDHVLVRAGAVLPADGVIMQGATALDESLMTGESRPVARAPGDRVVGGAVNVGQPMVLRVERVGADTWLAGIDRLVARAARERPRVVMLADRYAAVFVAVILALAALSGAYWWSESPARAIETAVIVLVVTCPCALSLATPLAWTTACAALARGGVLAVHPEALERLARATHVVFDKTGTLTEGELALDSCTVFERSTRAEALAVAIALEARASHPIALALVRAGDAGNASADALARPDVTVIAEHHGGGIEGRYGDRCVRLGTLAFGTALHGQPAPAVAEDDATIAALADDAGWLAVFRFTDRIRGDAAATVTRLRAQGLTPSILSGDRAQAVAAVGRALDIDEHRADCTPQAKREAIAGLQASGARVVMVGDGVNDAPVLAQADVSVAMARGAALAQQSADIVLAGDRLVPLGEAVSRARRTTRIVRQNLGWAFAYNVAAVPLAAAGLVPAWLAAVGMAASSLAVVLNSVR